MTPRSPRTLTGALSRVGTRALWALCVASFLVGAGAPASRVTVDVLTDFGADASGRLPATDAIQRALDVAAVAGGEVVVGEGTYAIDGTLRIGSGVTLLGDGPGRTVLRTTGCRHLLQNADPERGDRGVRVEGMTLEGDFDGGSRDLCEQQLVRLRNVEGFELRELELAASRGNGLVIAGASSRGSVQAVAAHGNGAIGVYVQTVRGEAGAPAVRILRSRAFDNGSSGFAAFSTEGIEYQECEAWSNGWHGTEGAGFNLDGARGVTYRRCTARGNALGFASYSAQWPNRSRLAGEALRYEECTAAENRGSGFLFVAPRGVRIEGSEALENGDHGLETRGDPGQAGLARLAMVGGRIVGNRRRAVDTLGADRFVLEDVVVRGNGRDSELARRSGKAVETVERPASTAASAPGAVPTGPGACPTLASWPDEFVEEVALEGDHAFLATEPGLVVLDISDPGAPAEVGRLETSGAGTAVAVAGSMAVLGTAAPDLQVFDVSNPAQPAFLGSTTLPEEARGITLSGPFAWVAAGTAGIRVVDLTDPQNPGEVGSLDPGWEVWDVVLRDGLGYVAAGPDGLRILDASDPTQPMELGAADTRRPAHGVGLAGRFAFVALSRLGLAVVNVHNAGSPFLIRLSQTGRSEAVAVVDGYARLASRATGLASVDVSDPRAPAPIGSLDTPGFAFDVAARNGYAFLADQAGGLAIWRTCELFTDSFESGDLSAWTTASP